VAKDARPVTLRKAAMSFTRRPAYSERPILRECAEEIGLAADWSAAEARSSRWRNGRPEANARGEASPVRPR
jgi:hypothetical protein